jgi:release factor glutamine methyltransferase
MRLFIPPGVFRPRSDSWLLARITGECIRPDDHVLDVCTGSGVVAVEAALQGAERVVAVDVSWRAVLTAQINGLLNGVVVEGCRGDLLGPVAGERFNLIVSNPPYLPQGDDPDPARGPARAWEGGRDGRRFLDRLIAAAPAHLYPGGALLLVHSSVCGLDKTEERMRAAGLHPQVLERRRGPLGPLLSARARTLEEERLLEPGERVEDIIVLQGTLLGG